MKPDGSEMPPFERILNRRNLLRNALGLVQASIAVDQGISQEAKLVISARTSSLRTGGIYDVPIEIANVWSGVAVSFGAIANDRFVYVGFYGLDRRLGVAQVVRETKTVLTRFVPNRFEGWDAHNIISIALDDADQLHVTGNMHATPLVYARSNRPNSLSGLDRLQPMIHRDEEMVTYPAFLTGPDGRLLFLYREGRSGDGVWLLNEWRGGWRRFGDHPLFSDRWRGVPVSAYPSRIIRSADGLFHIGVVWRKLGGASENFRISYVKTRDFSSFQGADGAPAALPIDPDGGDVVDDPGSDHGLLNNHRIGVDENGRPIIIFTRNDRRDNVKIVAARPKDGHWMQASIADLGTQNFSGRGTQTFSFAFGEPNFIDLRRLVIPILVPGGHLTSATLDSETLAVLSREPTKPLVPRSILGTEPDWLEAPKPMLVPVKTKGAYNDAPPIGYLFWYAQAPNNDKARICHPLGIAACDPPPAKLRLFLY